MAGLCWPVSTGTMTGNWKNPYMFVDRAAAKRKTLERLTVSATTLTLSLEERGVAVLTRYPFADTLRSFPG